ncbi:uncharacterized protein LOC143284956 [Babylonia areolata]|uniref:uncharacterized protein LOC143284956 n=1 Tax=Babylonia areolata TaxID=304850 RepID=UPI003FD02F30
MDYFPTDFESDSEQLFGMEFQRTTIRRQQEDNMHLSSSIQDFTTFDTSLMDEDDIPTRDAGLDLSYPVNVSGGGLPNEPDPDTSLRYLVDVGSSRISQPDQHSDSKKKRTKSKRRKEVERSKNNNSLNFREKLEQIERGEFCDEEPSCWERDNPFELIVTPQNVDMLLISARFYQQSQVVSICKDALVRCDVQDALYYRFVAEKHELADITPQLVDFVRANFTSITHTHSFLGLELNQLKALLSDDGLKVQSELDVFNAARAWIDHCKHLRIKRVGELMSCVRFNHISPEDIVRHVEPHKNYFRGPGGREVLLSIYRYHALHGSQGDLSAPQADMPPPRCYVPLGMAEPTGMASTLQFQQPVYSYQGQDPLQADRGQVPQYVHAQDAENLATETQTRSQSESQHQMIRNSCEHVLSAAENPKAQNTHFPQQPNNQVHLQRHHAYNHKQKPKRHLAEQTQPPNQEKQQQNRQRLNRWSRQHDEQDPSLQHHLDRNYHNYERHEDPTEQHLQELLHQQAQNAENYQRSLHRLRNAGRSGAKPPQQPITNNNQQLVTHNKQQPLTHKQRPLTQNKQRPATPTHIKLQPVTHHKQQPVAHNKRKLASPVCQLHQHSSHVRSNPGQQYNKFCNKSCNMPHYERQILNQQQGIVPPGDAVVQQQQLCIKQSGQRWGQETAEKIQGQGYTRRRRSESPADGKAPIRSRLNRPKSQPPPCGRRAVCKGNYFNENATNIQGGGETGPVNQGYPVGKTTQEGAPQIMDPMMDQQQGTDDDILPVNESGTPPEPTPGTGLIFRRHPYNNHGSHKMPMYPDEALVVVTGGLNPHLLHSEIPCRLMNCYNPSTNTWTLMGKLPEARHHHGCVMLDGYLYVIGGSLVDENDLFNMSLATSTCYRYDFGGNFWTAVGPMRLARMYHAVTVLEGIIYAMGGETSKETAVDPEDCFLDSCEYYNPDTDEWGPIANMRDSIIGAAIIGFRGMVWLIGGFVERRRSRVLLATVECYDPRTNSWVSMNPLPAPLCHATVAEVMNTLFVVGGAMSQQPDMPLISVGDVLQYLEVEDVWVTFSSLTIPRHDVNCCAIDSHLFILGGVSSRLAEVLEDMECIDISTGEWQADLEPLTSPAMGLACVAVTPDSFDK